MFLYRSIYINTIISIGDGKPAEKVISREETQKRKLLVFSRPLTSYINRVGGFTKG
jgi:hypothetical protein